uniref:BACK domain-containing protein n=1 Tax=Dunaliella tertiolecta TaxID=3047 RepID=A0A6S8Q7W7_DUNTE
MDENDELAAFYDFQVIFVPGLRRKVDGEEHGGPRKKQRTTVGATQNADAASLPGAVVVPTSKLLLGFHSGVLRSMLVDCKNEETLVVPCDDPEHAEAGRLVVEMILDLPRPTHLKKHDNLWHSLPPSQLIRCIHFAVFWDAQSCVELCIDSLTKVDLLHLSIEDVEALLDLPGAVQVVESQQRKVEEVCRKRLMQEFKNVPQVLADDALTHRLCSLSSSALALLCQCDLGSRGSRPCYLALWFSRAQGVTVTDMKKLLKMIPLLDVNLLLFLPPVCRGRDLCMKWLLFRFGIVHKAITDYYLRFMFCSLPFPVVSLWASLGQLQVYNENDVAVLLSYWCSANASRATPQNFAELSSLLRVGCLSPSFRHFTLRKLSWFTKSALLPYFNVAREADGDKVASKLGPSDADSIPPAWTAPPRRFGLPRLTSDLADTLLEHSFSRSEVVAMVESALQAGSREGIESPPLYYGGCFWKIRVELNVPGGCAVGVFLRCVTELPLPEPTLAGAAYSLRVLRDDGYLGIGGSDSRQWFKESQGLGMFADDVRIRSVGELDELLVDNQLRISCRMKDIA